jgi:GNAT superfamily N-acetyltransferase
MEGLGKTMTTDYAIEYRDQPEWDFIGGGIQDYNTRHAGVEGAKRLCFVARGSDQEIMGGVIGITFWDWLNIELMFIKEPHRRSGLGSRLLALAEEEGRKRGAKHVFLDTFTFQAPDFYKKHGYRVFGELKDFPEGFTRYYLTKEL